MRLSINFAPRVLPLAPLLFLLSVVIAASAAIASAWLLADAGRLRADSATLAARHQQWREKAAEIKSPPLPPLAALNDMKARVAKLNRLGDIRGRPLPEALRQLEMHLPDSVYLAQLSHRGATGELQLTAESAQATALTLFLVKLQQDRTFDEVLLTRQAQREAQGRKYIQFEIKLRQAQ